MAQKEVARETSREIMEGMKAHQIPLAEVVVHRTDGTVPRAPGFAERPSAERLPEEIEFGAGREERHEGRAPEVERLPAELPERERGPSAERLPAEIEFEERGEARGRGRPPEVERLPEDLQKAAREEKPEPVGDYIVVGEAQKKEGKKKKGEEGEWEPY